MFQAVRLEMRDSDRVSYLLKQELVRVCHRAPTGNSCGNRGIGDPHLKLEFRSVEGPTLRYYQGLCRSATSVPCPPWSSKACEKIVRKPEPNPDMSKGFDN